MAVAVPLLIVALGAAFFAGYRYSTLPPPNNPMRLPYENDVINALVVATLCAPAAGIAYLVLWTIGWIVAGFKADEH